MRFRKTLTLLFLAMGLIFALSAFVAPVSPPAFFGAEDSAATAIGCLGPGEPFTRDQVQGLVRDGLGDESGAKLIEQRRTDFVPLEIISRTRKW